MFGFVYGLTGLIQLGPGFLGFEYRGLHDPNNGFGSIVVHDIIDLYTYIQGPQGDTTVDDTNLALPIIRTVKIIPRV